MTLKSRIILKDLSIDSQTLRRAVKLGIAYYFSEQSNQTES